MPPAMPASRSVLSDQVKDRLLQAILTGRYSPGDRIVETRVARELGTSQAPVREALRDLGALGVVEISAFRGARVRRPSAAELLEAFVVRTELESLAVRLAVLNITDADIDELAVHIDAMYAAAQRRDAYAEATADAGFHRRIVEIASNKTLERVWRNLEPFSRTYITLATAALCGEQMAGLHRPVLAALRDRDAEQAMEAIRQHFREAAAMFSRVWTEGGRWMANPPGDDDPGDRSDGPRSTESQQRTTGGHASSRRRSA
jgi:DNA-binding GntR family transcriptional regulator